MSRAALNREGVMVTHREKEFFCESDIYPYLHPGSLQEQGDSVLDVSVFSLERVEKYAIEHVLRLCGNNKSRASKILGISRESLYRKMRQYGIPV